MQGVRNRFQKQEMELLKQEIELFLLLRGLQSKNFFDKVWSIQFKDSETRNRKWNYFSRKFNYFTYLDKSYVISNLCSYALFVLVIYSISILLISNLYPMSSLIYSDDHERAEGELMKRKLISASELISFYFISIISSSNQKIFYF